MDKGPPTMEPFDPAPLVALARAQRPDLPWLPDALARCTAGRRDGSAYVYFVEPDGPDWRFAENILLEDRRGSIVLDVLDGPRVGGAESLGRL